MDELLSSTSALTGVVCYNDLTAIGALRSLRAHGLRVPDDMSVVGFDDLDLAGYVDPPLTTIGQQKVEMARWAVERLSRLIAGEERGVVAGDRDRDGDRADAVVLPVQLIERESTGPARSQGAEARKEVKP